MQEERPATFSELGSHTDGVECKLRFSIISQELRFAIESLISVYCMNQTTALSNLHLCNGNNDTK